MWGYVPELTAQPKREEEIVLPLSHIFAGRSKCRNCFCLTHSEKQSLGNVHTLTYCKKLYFSQNEALPTIIHLCVQSLGQPHRRKVGDDAYLRHPREPRVIPANSSCADVTTLFCSKRTAVASQLRTAVPTSS